jgi:hypothetical protein
MYPTRTLASLSLIAALGLAACQESRDAAPPARKADPKAAAAGAPALDPRTQYDLARALSEAARDRAGAATSYARLRAAWLGHRYRWNVRVVEPLCRARDACNVLPFDRGGSDKKIVHGWMPRLVLDDAGFAAIQRACAGKPACRIGVEGTLSAFVLDPESPTSLELTQVRVL